MQKNTSLNTEITRLSGKVFLPTAEGQSLRRNARRQMNARVLKLLAVLWAVIFLAVAGQAQIITRISTPGKFYVDDKSGNGIVYNYAAYTVSNNTGVNFPSLYVAITNIVSTNRILLASADTGVRALGSLSPGETKLAAF